MMWVGNLSHAFFERRWGTFFLVVGAASTFAVGALAQSPFRIFGVPRQAEAGSLITLSVECLTAVPVAPGFALGLMTLGLVSLGLATIGRRRLSAVLLGFALLLVFSGKQQAQAQNCGATQWTASSASETFVGTGLTFSFIPTQSGVFQVTASQAGVAAQVSLPVCNGCTGYLDDGLWQGQTWVAPSLNAAGEPQANIEVATTLQTFPLCVQGTVEANADAAAMVGWNVAQLTGDIPQGVTPLEDGLDVRVTNFAGTPLRVELNGANAALNVEERFCADVPPNGGFVPFTAFAANCVSGASGAPYTQQTFVSVLLVVAGNASEPRPFEFCINGVEQSDRCADSMNLDDGDPSTLDRCDPETGAVHIPIPETDPAVQGTVLSDNQWLVETGVQPDLDVENLEARRVALVRGRVLDSDGAPVANVDIRVQDRPEFGHTTTHADGSFDLLINGGGPLELQFDKTPKFLASARTANVAWNGTTIVGDVVLLRPDRQVTKVSLGTQMSTYESAVGSAMTDDSGSRTGAVLFPPGVEALMVGTDGSSQALDSLKVRITEFTVGQQGLAAMPADLAYNTAYTYAFEVNADEAVASGSPEILFSEPLPYYVDNYMDFPVGTLVPLGSYDRPRGKWVPEKDGMVLGIVGVQGGLAELDVTGDGVADGSVELDEWGITDAERAKLAELCTSGVYSVQQSLWRLQIPHFTTPWDANTGFAFPDDAIETDDANAPAPTDPDVDDGCEVQNASTIECQTQVFRETIPVVGTPYALHYNSERVPGRAQRYSVRGRISSGPLPSSLLRTTVDLHVGGRKISNVYPPTAAEQQYEVIWDGYDTRGRRLYGPQDASLTFCYVYRARRVTPPRSLMGSSGGVGGGGGGGGGFSASGGSELGVRPQSDPEVESCRTWPVTIGSGNVSAGLGEWTLDVHHQVSGRQGTVLLGDGTSHHATSLAPVTVGVAGSKGTSADFNGVDARLARLPAVASIKPVMVAGADGSLYYSDGQNPLRVRKVGSDGLLSTVAGGGNGPDGGPAVGASIGYVSGIDVTSDGTVYFTELDRGQVRKVSPDGIISTVAGTLLTGGGHLIVNGALATESLLGNAWDVRVAPDGSLYVASAGMVTRVDANGYVRRIAGKGSSGDSTFDGAKALDVFLDPRRLAFSPAGDLYILHSNVFQGSIGHRLYRLEGDTLKLVAGCEVAPCTRTLGTQATAFTLDVRGRDALAFDRSGGMFFIGDINPGSPEDFRALTIDRGGHVQGVFTGPLDHREGLIASEANMQAHSLTYGPFGLMVYHTKLPPNAGYSQITGLTRTPQIFGGSARVLASESGNEVYVFDDAGHHIETRDAYTTTTGIRSLMTTMGGYRR